MFSKAQKHHYHGPTLQLQQELQRVLMAHSIGKLLLNNLTLDTQLRNMTTSLVSGYQSLAIQILQFAEVLT